MEQPLRRLQDRPGEFKDAVRSLNLPLSEHEVEHLFLDLDLTQTGHITLDEFREEQCSASTAS